MAELTTREGFSQTFRGNGLDPDLLNAIARAAANAPPEISRVELISGAASRAYTTNHPAGRAIDVQLYDANARALHNNPISVNSSAATKAAAAAAYPAYQAFAGLVQSAYKSSTGRDVTWGGVFGPDRYGKNAMDLMHFDTRAKAVVEGPMGSIKNGPSKAALESYIPAYTGKTFATPDADDEDMPAGYDAFLGARQQQQSPFASSAVNSMFGGAGGFGLAPPSGMEFDSFPAGSPRDFAYSAPGDITRGLFGNAIDEEFGLPVAQARDIGPAVGPASRDETGYLGISGSPFGFETASRAGGAFSPAAFAAMLDAAGLNAPLLGAQSVDEGGFSGITAPQSGSQSFDEAGFEGFGRGAPSFDEGGFAGFGMGGPSFEESGFAGLPGLLSGAQSFDESGFPGFSAPRSGAHDESGFAGFSQIDPSWTSVKQDAPAFDGGGFSRVSLDPYTNMAANFFGGIPSAASDLAFPASAGGMAGGPGSLMAAYDRDPGAYAPSSWADTMFDDDTAFAADYGMGGMNGPGASADWGGWGQTGIGSIGGGGMAAASSPSPNVSTGYGKSADDAASLFGGLPFVASMPWAETNAPLSTTNGLSAFTGAGAFMGSRGSEQDALPAVADKGGSWLDLPTVGRELGNMFGPGVQNLANRAAENINPGAFLGGMVKEYTKGGDDIPTAMGKATSLGLGLVGIGDRLGKEASFLGAGLKEAGKAGAIVGDVLGKFFSPSLPTVAVQPVTTYRGGVTTTGGPMSYAGGGGGAGGMVGMPDVPSWAPAGLNVTAVYGPNYDPVGGGSPYTAVTGYNDAGQGYGAYQADNGNVYSYATYDVATPYDGAEGALSGADASYGGGSATVLCTYYMRRGWLPRRLWAADMRFSATLPAGMRRGYLAWATPLVQRLEHGDAHLERALWPVVRAWARYAAFRQGHVARRPLAGLAVHLVLGALSWCVGKWASPRAATA